MTKAFEVVTESLKRKGLSSVAKPGGSQVFGIWPATIEDLEPLEKDFVNLLQNKIPTTEILNLLDAGCGNGLAIISLLNLLSGYRKLDLTLTDIQLEAVNEAIENIKLAAFPNLEITNQVSSVVSLDISSDSMHGIICKSVLGWLPSEEDIHLALKEFYRVLKPGCLIYVEVMTPFNQVGIKAIPNYKSEYLQSRREVMEQICRFNGKESSDIIYVESPHYNRRVHLFTERSLSKVFDQAGFKVESTMYIRNEVFPNGLLGDYHENLTLIAHKL